jgi:hypothetical protein
LPLSLFRAVGHDVGVEKSYDVWGRVRGGKEERGKDVQTTSCLFVVADDEEFSHKPNLNLEKYFNISRVFAHVNINVTVSSSTTITRQRQRHQQQQHHMSNNDNWSSRHGCAPDARTTAYFWPFLAILGLTYSHSPATSICDPYTPIPNPYFCF